MNTANITSCLKINFWIRLVFPLLIYNPHSHIFDPILWSLFKAQSPEFTVTRLCQSRYRHFPFASLRPAASASGMPLISNGFKATLRIEKCLIDQGLCKELCEFMPSYITTCVSSTTPGWPMQSLLQLGGPIWLLVNMSLLLQEQRRKWILSCRSPWNGRL